ncbi:Uncharacterised protein [Candidatus Gugararchaeum adminiculabundum]|nr:Uncharacterised protein [Candidatus Gugararchaeum adminiculabundum]
MGTDYAEPKQQAKIKQASARAAELKGRMKPAVRAFFFALLGAITLSAIAPLPLGAGANNIKNGKQNSSMANMGTKTKEDALAQVEINGHPMKEPSHGFFASIGDALKNAKKDESVVTLRAKKDETLVVALERGQEFYALDNKKLDKGDYATKVYWARDGKGYKTSDALEVGISPKTVPDKTPKGAEWPPKVEGKQEEKKGGKTKPGDIEAIVKRIEDYANKHEGNELAVYLNWQIANAKKFPTGDTAKAWLQFKESDAYKTAIEKVTNVDSGISELNWSAKAAETMRKYGISESEITVAVKFIDNEITYGRVAFVSKLLPELAYAANFMDGQEGKAEPGTLMLLLSSVGLKKTQIEDQLERATPLESAMSRFYTTMGSNLAQRTYGYQEGIKDMLWENVESDKYLNEGDGSIALQKRLETPIYGLYLPIFNSITNLSSRVVQPWAPQFTKNLDIPYIFNGIGIIPDQGIPGKPFSTRRATLSMVEGVIQSTYVNFFDVPVESDDTKGKATFDGTEIKTRDKQEDTGGISYYGHLYAEKKIALADKLKQAKKPEEVVQALNESELGKNSKEGQVFLVYTNIGKEKIRRDIAFRNEEKIVLSASPPGSVIIDASKEENLAEEKKLFGNGIAGALGVLGERDAGETIVATYSVNVKSEVLPPSGSRLMLKNGNPRIGFESWTLPKSGEPLPGSLEASVWTNQISGQLVNARVEDTWVKNLRVSDSQFQKSSEFVLNEYPLKDGIADGTAIAVYRKNESDGLERWTYLKRGENFVYMGTDKNVNGGNDSTFLGVERGKMLTELESKKVGDFVMFAYDAPKVSGGTVLDSETKNKVAMALFDQGEGNCLTVEAWDLKGSTALGVGQTKGVPGENYLNVSWLEGSGNRRVRYTKWNKEDFVNGALMQGVDKWGKKINDKYGEYRDQMKNGLMYVAVMDAQSYGRNSMDAAAIMETNLGVGKTLRVQSIAQNDYGMQTFVNKVTWVKGEGGQVVPEITYVTEIGKLNERNFASITSRVRYKDNMRTITGVTIDRIIDAGGRVVYSKGDLFAYANARNADGLAVSIAKIGKEGLKDIPGISEYVHYDGKGYGIQEKNMPDSVNAIFAMAGKRKGDNSLFCGGEFITGQGGAEAGREAVGIYYTKNAWDAAHSSTAKSEKFFVAYEKNQGLLFMTSRDITPEMWESGKFREDVKRLGYSMYTYAPGESTRLDLSYERNLSEKYEFTYLKQKGTASLAIKLTYEHGIGIREVKGEMMIGFPTEELKHGINPMLKALGALFKGVFK